MLIVLRWLPTAEAVTVAATRRIDTSANPPSVSALLIRSLLRGLGSRTTFGIPSSARRPYALVTAKSTRLVARTTDLTELRLARLPPRGRIPGVRPVDRFPYRGY